MKKQIFILLSLALVAFGCERTRQTSPVQEPQKTAASPVYVLSDEYGEKFLLLDHFESPTPDVPEILSSYSYVIYQGRYYPVSFRGCQLENEENNNGRETCYNFDNLSGWLYMMKSGKLLEKPADEFDAVWEAPLLVDEHFKNENTVFALSNDREGHMVYEDLPEELNEAFEQRYGREILSSWCAAVFGENDAYQFVNIQFENVGNEALGVSALIQNGEIKAVMEFPAEWNEESVWRVDDGGEFGGLSIDFVTINDGVLTLYTADSGPEGTNYQSYVLEEDHFIPGQVSASFYQAPY